jgi:M6 family metalloprotease-like protein
MRSGIGIFSNLLQTSGMSSFMRFSQFFLIPFLFLGLWGSVLIGQIPQYTFMKGVIPPIDSTKGNNLPAFDTLRVLYVFVRFRNGEEPEQGIPQWPMNRREAPAFGRDWLAPSPDKLPGKSLSQYFQEASLGRFIYWGDIYPDIIVLDSSIAWYHSQGGYSACSREIIRKMDASGKVNWRLYDNWGKASGKWIKSPDKMIDHLAVIYRTTPPAIDSKCAWLGSGGGIAGLQGGVEWIKDSLFVHGGNLMSGLIVNGGGTGDPNETMKTLKHETAHFLTLFHYSATNDRSGGPDLGTHGGWGLASASGSSSIAVNSWDRDWLGWSKFNQTLDPDSIKEAIITLGDFITTGASIKIKVPDVQDEWYLLEYHANIGAFDEVDKDSKALFILHQTGAQGPHHLDVEEADGKFDYELIEQTDTRCCGRHWRLRKKYSNPLIGYGDRDVLHLDKDGDGKLNRNDASGIPVFMVDQDGEEEIIHYLGDGRDGFTDQSGRNEFSIATNPSSASNGSKLRDPISRLNGLQIKVLSQTDSSITFFYKANHFQIDRNVRWSGIVELNDSLTLIQNTDMYLVPSATFLKMNDTFPGGHLQIRAGGKLFMQRGSTLTIQNKGTLTLHPGAKIYMEKRSRIVIEKGGRMNYLQGQVVFLGKGSKIVEYP